MKLAEWARKNSVHPRTAERWFHNGTLPVKATQLKTGTILILDSLENNKNEKKLKKVILYARVSTYDQKKDLIGQINRMREFSSKNGFIVKDEVTEIASGLNDRRSKLIKILKNKSIDGIVVEYKDRLTRFGFNLLKETLSAYNIEIFVLNNSDVKNDLIQDFIDVIISMCSRIYGKRASKNKKEKILETIKNE